MANDEPATPTNEGNTLTYPYGPPSGPQPQQPYGQPGYGQPQPFVFGPGGAPPDNNLGWGIGAIFLCWPFAIPSIIKATSVQALWAQGQFVAAQSAADEAKKWGKLGIILGACAYGAVILLYVVYFVVFILFFGAAVVSST